MLSKLILTLIITFGASFASVNWSIDTVRSGKSAEDSLILSISSSPGYLPTRMGLSMLGACSTSTDPYFDQVIPGLETRPVAKRRAHTWVILPGQIPAGIHCLALHDLTADTLLTSAKNLRWLSRLRHTLISQQKESPWTTEWNRPQYVPWSRVQIMERDSLGSKQERIISDIITQELSASPLQAGINLSPKLPHWMRIANAYGNSPEYTDLGSWVVFPLSTTFDTLNTPVLKQPLVGASISRSAQSGIVSFTWNPVPEATAYQVSLMRKSANQWVTEISLSTSESSVAISQERLIQGTWKWVVGAIGSNSQRSLSTSRIFSIGQGVPVRTFRVILNGKPVNGARVDLSAWGSTQSVSGLTGSLTGLAGSVSLRCSPGNAEISVEINGYPKWQQTVVISDDQDIPAATIELPIYSTQHSILRGRILDKQGFPLPGIRIECLNTQGDSIRTLSSGDGSWSISLGSGIWKWKILSLDGSGIDSGSVTFGQSQNKNLGSISIAKMAARMEGRIVTTLGEPIPGAIITIRDQSQQVRYSTVTDRYGNYRTLPAQGHWFLTIEAQGYLAVSEELFLQGIRSKDYRLETGSIHAEGVVKELEEAVLGTKLERVLAGVQVLAWDSLVEGDTLQTKTDQNGVFSISLPQAGTYVFQAFHSGMASNRQAGAFSSSTGGSSLDLAFTLEARVEGSIQLSGSTPDSIAVFLFATGREIARTFAKPGSAAVWDYRFRNVSPGEYSVIVRHPGFRQVDTTQVSVLQQGSFLGRGTVTGSPCTLEPSGTRLALYSLRKSLTYEKLVAHAQFEIPQDTLVALPDTLTLGGGRTRVSVFPEISQWIPLYQYEISLPDSGLQKDSILFPAFHAAPKSFTPGAGDSINITLELFSPIDSAFLWIQDLNTNASRRIVPLQTDADLVTYSFQPRTKVPRLSYWFEVYSSNGTQRFYNPPPASHFTVPIQWATLPIEISLQTPDTLRTIVGTSLDLPVLANTGAIPTWSATPAGMVSLVPNDSGLGATVTARQAGNTLITLIAENGPYSDTATFVLVAATGESIRGSLKLQERLTASPYWNGATLLLAANLTDTLGREWRVPAEWSVLPASAVREWRGDSALLDSNFIGPLWIKSTYMAGRDSLMLPIGYRVSSFNEARRLRYDSLVELHLPDSLWADGISHRIELDRWTGAANLSNATPGQDTVTGFFNAQFFGALPNRVPSLACKISSSGTRILWPARVNATQSILQRLDQVYDSASAPVNALARLSLGTPDSIELDTLQEHSNTWLLLALLGNLPSYYGLMGDPDSLRTAEMRIVPNPFSPWVTAAIDGNTEPGTEIRFTPYLPGKISVHVRLEIIGMSGDPVRVLIDDRMLRVQPQKISWNGITDDGSLVRNGRYLIILSLRGSPGGKILRRIAKPVVVFK